MPEDFSSPQPESEIVGVAPENIQAPQPVEVRKPLLSRQAILSIILLLAIVGLTYVVRDARKLGENKRAAEEEAAKMMLQPQTQAPQ